LQAAARQNGLDFIPLFEERFDIVVSADYAPQVAPLFDELQTADFRSAVRKLSGYNLAHSGETVVY